MDDQPQPTQPDLNPNQDVPCPSPNSQARGGLSSRASDDQITWAIAVGVFIFALVLYAATMCRTVFWWDSGELVANASILGIPHRPGFPLYILLARVFGLPPVGSYFYRINFFSVLCAAVTAGVFTHAFIHLLVRYVKVYRSAVYAALLAASALVLTYTFWIQAVRTEVYALNGLIVAVIILLLERADATAKTKNRVRTRCIYGAVFLFGLGLGGHHATLVSTAPAVAVLAAVILGRQIMRPGFLLTAGLFFVMGMSIYLYLPLRALQSPLLNWGWNTGSIAEGAQSVMATDAYGYLSALTPKVVAGKFLLALELISDQTGRPLAFLSGIGLLFWFRRSRRWAWFFVLLAVGNMLVVALLATEFIEWNADLHGYLLPTLVAMVFGMVAGFFLIVEHVFQLLNKVIRTGHLRLAAKTCLVGIAIMLALTPGLISGPFCDLSENRLAYDLGYETLAGLPPGAVVIMEGVNWNFVLRGLQFAAGLRPDVALINRSLMPARWYQSQCRRRYPHLIADVGFPSGTRVRETIAWADEIRATGRPVYWEFTERELPHFRRFKPAGHLYRLSRPDSALADSLIISQEHFERSSRFYGAVEALRYDFDAQGIYIHNLYRAGLYYESWGLLYRAKELYRRALSVRPAEGILKRALLRVEKLPVISSDDMGE